MKFFTLLAVATSALFAQSAGTIETKATLGEATVLIEVRDQSDQMVDSFRVTGRIQLPDGSQSPFNAVAACRAIADWCSVTVTVPAKPVGIGLMYVSKLRPDPAVRVQ